MELTFAYWTPQKPYPLALGNVRCVNVRVVHKFLVLPAACCGAELLGGHTLQYFAADDGAAHLPTLIRFVFVLAGLAALAYGGLFALANYVKISPHEISEPIELPKAQP